MGTLEDGLVWLSLDYSKLESLSEEMEVRQTCARQPSHSGITVPPATPPIAFTPKYAVGTAPQHFQKEPKPSPNGAGRLTKAEHGKGEWASPKKKKAKYVTPRRRQTVSHKVTTNLRENSDPLCAGGGLQPK